MRWVKEAKRERERKREANWIGSSKESQSRRKKGRSYGQEKGGEEQLDNKSKDQQ